MDAQKLSAAIKLSVEAALTSQQTTVAEAVFVLEVHKATLVKMALQPRPEQVKIQPATIIPHINGRG